jgi:hypothetical protein
MKGIVYRREETAIDELTARSARGVGLVHVGGGSESILESLSQPLVPEIGEGKWY